MKRESDLPQRLPKDQWMVHHHHHACCTQSHMLHTVMIPVQESCIVVHTIMDADESQLQLYATPPGFVIEGFDLEHSHECYQSILQSATSVLPQSSPRFIHGVYSPGNTHA